MTSCVGWRWEDSEFTTPGNQGEQHRMDLLTVLDHEIGHLLGYDHSEGGVMDDRLDAGVRHTPARGFTVVEPAVLDSILALDWTKWQHDWHRNDVLDVFAAPRHGHAASQKS